MRRRPTLIVLGRRQVGRGELESARGSYRLSIRIGERSSGSRASTLWGTRKALGQVLVNLGEHEATRVEPGRALDELRAIEGGESDARDIEALLARLAEG